MTHSRLMDGLWDAYSAICSLEIFHSVVASRTGSFNILFPTHGCQ